MRLLLHDYAGHPFQAELARTVAGRGFDVLHASCSSYVSGKGQLDGGSELRLEFVGLSVGGAFHKYRYAARLLQEVRYAREFMRLVLSWTPDVVINCNVPLLAHALISRELKRRGIPEIFWHQDVYSAAIAATAKQRLGSIGAVISNAANRLERGIARRASAIVAISETFLNVHDKWGTREKVTVQPNWAPLDDLSPRARDNDWATAHLADGPRVMYAGTLGIKHDPRLLMELHRLVARQVQNLQTIVVSDGPVAGRLQRQAPEGVRVLPFQPYEKLAEVLSSADVLVTILERDASHYSVPSKAYSYFAVGRPVVAAVNPDSAIAQIVSAAGGVVADTDPAGVQRLAEETVSILTDGSRRRRMGHCVRRYAEENFDAEKAAETFLAICEGIRGQSLSRDGLAPVRQKVGLSRRHLLTRDYRRWPQGRASHYHRQVAAARDRARVTFPRR